MKRFVMDVLIIGVFVSVLIIAWLAWFGIINMDYIGMVPVVVLAMIAIVFVRVLGDE